jgi:hypothetical protein
MFTHNQLQSLADDVLEKYPNINSGGCCVFAAHVAQELQHHFKVRIIAFSNNGNKNNIDDIRPLIKKNVPTEWRDNGCAFNHVVVEIMDNKGIVWNYDACGIFPDDGSICTFERLQGYLTIKEALELANSKPGWNKVFNRRDIPAIRKLILNHFYGDIKVGLGTRMKTFLSSLSSRVITC